MNKIVNILLITLLMIAACACHKENRFITDMPITMSLTEAGSTKALLDATTFETTGNRIKIYDYYTDGSIDDGYYINDTIKCSTPGLWPFEKESYKWTTDGVHMFFGWLVDDVRETESFTPTFNESEKVLSIPATTFGQNSVQYDFMYSDIHERNLKNNPYFTAVPLNFSHLFTAFKVTASNNSSNRIILRSVTISGLKNQKAATINYSDSALVNKKNEAQSNYSPIVEYSSLASEGTFIFSKEVNGEGCLLPPYNQDAQLPPEPVSNGYYLMWPQSSADLKFDQTIPSAIATVVYDYIEIDDEGNQEEPMQVTKNVKLEGVGSLDAGNKYNLNIQFRDKEVELQCFVQNWIPMEEQIDFTETVYASKPLTWVEGTVEYDDPATGRVILFSDEDMVAECKFKIDTPRGATWAASLISIEGRPDAFSIVEDTKYGPVGLERSIKIKINKIDPISPRNVCKLRITVQTADGRTIVVNNLMPETTDQSITEYTIIQNRING